MSSLQELGGLKPDYNILASLYTRAEADNQELKKKLSQTKQKLSSIQNQEEFLRDENLSLKRMIKKVEDDIRTKSSQLSNYEQLILELQGREHEKFLQLEKAVQDIEDMRRPISDLREQKTEIMEEAKKLAQSLQETEQKIKNELKNSQMDKLLYDGICRQLMVTCLERKMEIKEVDNLIHKARQELESLNGKNDLLKNKRKKNGLFACIFVCFRRCRSARR